MTTSLSWKNTCYIHAGISGPEVTVKGPDAEALVSMSAINSVKNWKVGRAKHLAMLDENGLLQMHGLCNRTGEDSFALSASLPFPWVELLQTGEYNAEMTMRDIFVYQCAGPNSLTCLEELTQTNLHDMKCLDFRHVTIPGIDCDVEVERVGMSGTLSYELRGPTECGPEVYDALYQLGKEKYDMKRLGWRTYTVNHTEAGYPQFSVHFLTPLMFNQEFKSSPDNKWNPTLSGSYSPDNERARLRTLVEVGWDWMAKFDHEFVGRNALEEEMAAPKRTIVTLEWNSEDVIDIYASQFRDGEPYKYMEMPSAPQQPTGAHADRVLSKDGKEIGISSCAIYSVYYHKTISHCTIDVEYAEIGSEVIVEWGDFGGKIKQVRATVSRFPYLDLIRNEKYDVETVPYGCKR